MILEWIRFYTIHVIIQGLSILHHLPYVFAYVACHSLWLLPNDYHLQDLLSEAQVPLASKQSALSFQ